MMRPLRSPRGGPRHIARSWRRHQERHLPDAIRVDSQNASSSPAQDGSATRRYPRDAQSSEPGVTNPLAKHYMHRVCCGDDLRPARSRASRIAAGRPRGQQPCACGALSVVCRHTDRNLLICCDDPTAAIGSIFQSTAGLTGIRGELDRRPIHWFCYSAGPSGSSSVGRGFEPRPPHFRAFFPRSVLFGQRLFTAFSDGSVEQTATCA